MKGGILQSFERFLMSGAFVISITYAVLSFVWVWGSNNVVLWIAGGNRQLNLTLLTIKGFAFIIVSATLLYYAIRYYVSRQEANEETIRQNYEVLVKSQKALSDSEAEYRNILRTTMDGFIVADMAGSFVDVNNAFCAMLGYTREELLTLSVRLIEDLETPEEIARHCEKIIRQGEDRFETRYRRKDGRIMDAEVSVVYAETHGGRFVAFHRDITERKRGEELLRESEARYRTLVETTGTGFVVLDASGRVLDANLHYVHMAGHHDLQEILGRSVLEWTAEYEKEKNSQAVAQCLRDGLIRNFEVDYTDSSGHLTPIEINATVITSNGSIRIITLCRDISERKRSVDEIRHKTDELRAAYEQMTASEEELRHNYDELARNQQALANARKKLSILNAVTFQDIQNEMFSLSGYLALEKDVATDEKHRQYLEKQAGLVRSISGSLKFANYYQNLGLTPPRWQNVTQSFLFGISHLDISNFVRKLDVDDLEIYADPLLEMVFFALAENVVLHGKNATEMVLRNQVTPEGITLFFEDNGAGIPPETKEQIFNREYAEQKGMGLFLVREILSITGITIRETGEPGKGGRFEIMVPKEAYRFQKLV